MTDKELLEAAARAAGIEIEHRYEEPSHFRGLLLKAWKAPNTMAFWNPLTDDGDALRLAVKLEMGLAIFSVFVEATDGLSIDVSEKTEADPYAATRRAIVRAAAEIGQKIPNNRKLKSA